MPAEGSARALPPLAKDVADTFRELVRDASCRKELSAFIVEGPHLVERALQMNPNIIEHVAITEHAAERESKLLALLFSQTKHVSLITEKISEKISDTRSPQGIFARVTLSHLAVSTIRKNDGIILALDGVQDPGNIGTIIRTAAWFGIKHIILGEGCADVYSPKVLRSTQGEIFSVMTYGQIPLLPVVTKLKMQGYSLTTTTLSPASGSIYEAAPHENSVIVFGSEAHGVRDEILACADTHVMIPRYGTGESLNVATSVGIILAEIKRRVSVQE